MKQLHYLALALLLPMLVFSQKKQTEAVKSKEQFRSQYHFSTQNNRMGAPLSMVFNDSTLHLFYQYNPFGFDKGNYHWGHAISSDYIKFDEQAVTLKPIEPSDSMANTPWFGNVLKVENGFKAWVTFWGDGIYALYSENGTNWENKTKTTGTEELMHSEPCIYWHNESQNWIMFAYNRPAGNMHFLKSTDGIKWETVSTFRYNFGFPKIAEMPINGNSNDKRLVVFSEYGTYIVVSFDGNKLGLETSVMKFNHGRSIGACAIAFDPQKMRFILATEIKTDPFNDLELNSQLSVLSEIKLIQHNGQLELRANPLPQLQNLLGKAKVIKGKKVYPGVENNLLSGTKGTQKHIKATIGIGSSDQFGLIICTNGNKTGLEVNISPKRKTMNILGAHIEDYELGQTVEIEILVDKSVVEVFIDGGKVFVASSHTPDNKSNKYHIYTIGGEIEASQIEISEVKSVYTDVKK